MQPDTIIPDLSNPQGWNRYSYGLNNPIKFNDPSGHWVNIAIGAAVGFFAGAALYLYSESKQDGFDFKKDWTDLIVAAGTGAVAGGLIMTPGATSLGIGLASGLLADHATNLFTHKDFSSASHLEAGGLGLVTGSTTNFLVAGAGLSATDTVIMSGLSGAATTGYWKMLQHVFNKREYMWEDEIDILASGLGESVGAASSLGLKPIIGQTASELFGGLTSAAIETTKNIGQGSSQAPNVPTTPTSTFHRRPGGCIGTMTCRGGLQD